MVTIVIQDLLESTQLDRQARQAITGGSRFRGGGGGGGGGPIGRPAQQRVRLFDLAAGKAPAKRAAAR
ncbi:hypothetical protein [Massilia psychrophila]|uniref:Uncharacterized protein n=1 Tax=Massilia psychrophila TaxID=1603353 RepID=A0A2G8T3L6_9BURK|nr:hypothetical protein [Massilia psychrophila]PIL40614.1 hypothetical protein CR103_06855 [Massilia psychrophila]GGE74681.1 hypothetical protein GCM10008020_19200 [Massilia psychrophila]